LVAFIVLTVVRPAKAIIPHLTRKEWVGFSMTSIDKKRIPSFFLAFTLAVVFLGSLLQRDFGHYTHRDLDFFVYYFAAQMVHEDPGANIYYGDLNGNPWAQDAPKEAELYKKANQSGFDEIMVYLYPPILADLLVPLSRFSPNAAAAIWRIVNLSLVFLSVLTLSRMLRIRLISPEFGILVLAAYAFFPISEGIVVEQITIVLMALWTVAVFSYGQGWIALSACALALATALKVTPFLVVPVFLVLGEKEMAGVVRGGAGLSGLSDGPIQWMESRANEL